MKKLIYLIGIALIFNISFGQHESKYFPPEDPLVVEKLEQWQDLKFGLLMHWGPYSQWGIVESWSICPEDYRSGLPFQCTSEIKCYERDFQRIQGSGILDRGLFLQTRLAQ